jgi:LysM repeat protein
MPPLQGAVGSSNVSGTSPIPDDDSNRNRKKMDEAITAAQRARAAHGGPTQTASNEVPYAAHRGDTMWGVARKNGDSLSDLTGANQQIRNPNRIKPGDILFVPTHDPATIRTRQQVADAEAADRNVAGVEAKLRDPGLAPDTRKVMLQKLADARADASSKWTNVRTSVENELIDDGVGTTASDTAVRSLVDQIRTRAPDSQKFQTIVDDVAKQAPIDGNVRAIVAKAQGQSDPAAALHTLNAGYASATPDVQDTLLRDPGARKIIANVVMWADQPLRQKADGTTMPQAQTAQAIQRLDQATRSTDKNLAGAVVDRAVADYEQFHTSNQGRLAGGSPFGSVGMTTLIDLSGRIAGSKSGDDAISRFAGMGAWNGDSVRNAIAAGADPAYAIELARQFKQASVNPSIVVQTINDGIALRDQQKIASGGSPAATIDVANRMQAAGLDSSRVMKVAADSVQQFKNKVDGDVGKLAQHNAELGWLLQNDGVGMTSQQISQAVAAYRDSKGAPWQAENAKLGQQIADDGSKLVDQMTTLNQLPSQLSGSRTLADQTLRTIANDPAAGLAISVAIQSDPKLADPNHVRDVADIFSLSKVGDIARKYTNEIASIQLRRMVLSKLQNVNLSDPASVKQAKQALLSIAADPSMRMAGVTESDLKKAVTEVDRTVDKIVAAKSQDEVDAALKGLDKKFNTDASLSKTFNKSTVPGQLLRGFAVAFAGASLINSWSNFNSNPSDPRNDIKLLLDAAGFAQKNSELLVGLGWIDKQSALGQFGGEWKLFARASAGDLINGVSAALDLYSAARSGFGIGVPQDTGSAFFSATTAVGGGLAVAPAFGAAATLGVVGLGVTLLGLIGKSVYDSNKDAHQYEGASKVFLKGAGYNDAAAQALSGRDGITSGAAGAGQMPFLTKYAQFKHMTPDQLRNWVNSLTSEQVSHLSARIQQTAGDCHGDPRQFTDGPPQVQTIPNSDGPATEITLDNTLGVFDGNLTYDHVPHP